MGQKITQTNKITPDIEVFLMKYYPYFQCKGLLNNGILIKTALILNESKVSSENGEPLIIKIYFKPDDLSDFDKPQYDNQKIILERLTKRIQDDKMLHIAPILFIEENFKAGLIIRQYYTYNLKERINLLPYLTQVEKKWIAFQLLYAVYELHSIYQCHGDIKMENILLTSNTSVYLSDISPYKPAYIQTDDVTSYTYYFGSTNANLKSCCLAPERLVDSKEFDRKKDDLYNKEKSMDIFSIGAVLAELFLEDPLFDYSRLLMYKKGTYSINESLSRLKNDTFIDLLQRMLVMDPAMRIDIVDALRIFSVDICPISIPRYFFHFNILISTSIYYKPDMQICYVYKHWKQIWRILFGLGESPPLLMSKPKLSLVNKLLLNNPSLYFEACKGIQRDSDGIIIKGFEFLLPKSSNITLFHEDQLTDDLMTSNDNDDSKFIFINNLLQNILNMKYDSSTLLAIEMLEHLSMKLSDMEVIQIIIPYLVYLLKQKNYLTSLTALNVLIKLLYTIDYDTLILPPSDYYFFDSYLFPAIIELYNKENATTLTNIIDTLIDLEEKFLSITIRSRIAHFNSTKGKEEEGASSGDTKALTNKKINEMYASYDDTLNEFKMKLMKIVGDIVSQNEKIDIQQTLIRKFPALLKFYGRSEVNSFCQYTISNFNTQEWIIHRDILNNLPKIVPLLGDEMFINFILPCLEGMFTNNINELKTYELLVSINELIRQEYITLHNSSRLFNTIIPFILHPNLLIREEVVNLLKYMISLLHNKEDRLYFNEALYSYLINPLLTIDYEQLDNNIKKPICRVIYKLKLKRIPYAFRENDDSADDATFKINFSKCYGKQYYTNINDNTNNNRRKISQFDREFLRMRINNSVEAVKISPFFITDYEKHCAKIHVKTASVYEILFVSIIIRTINEMLTENLTLMNAIDKIDFNHPEQNFLSLDHFYSNFLFKAFAINYKKDNVHEMILELDQWKSNMNDLSSSGGGGDSLITNSTMNSITTTVNSTSTIVNGTGSSMMNSKKNYYNWRPQGKLLTTTYSHNAFEKMLPFQNNQFATFDSEGNITLWELTDNEDDTNTKIDIIWKNEPSKDYNIPVNDHERNTYRNGICLFNNNESFLTSYKNTIWKHHLSSKVKTSSKFIELNEGVDINAIESNQIHQNQIVIITQDNTLHIYDNRTKHVSQTCLLNKQRGIASCISFADQSLNCHIGTVNGFILSYDIRLNKINESFVYHENTPIISIDIFKPGYVYGNDIYPEAISSSGQSSKFLIVNSGAGDHEVGLWSILDQRCSILFKVNSFKHEEGKYQALTVELPELFNEDKIFINPEIKVLRECFNNLRQYTHNYSNNSITKLWKTEINRGYYHSSQKRFYRMMKVYEGESTAQKVLALQGIPALTFTNENCPFIITAGNDRTIRYWDISKDGLEKKSFIINAPNDLHSAKYTTHVFDRTMILQSNEIVQSNELRYDSPSLSEYQNYNSLTFNMVTQNYYGQESNRLNYCTKISDASHRGIITDLLPMMSQDQKNTFLISSSMDGSIKVWK